MRVTIIKRVLRGGSWNNKASNCRVSNRNYNTPSNRNNNTGFRVVCLPLAQFGWIS
ncbi:MAG: SUMF1/EgtB/PvdO family nonheme iron enzyme [Paraprevotella sp.]|nr:SUMF1/EgtB/PvdO family nonheme iron enzyme [Paraprevotella sp.]